MSIKADLENWVHWILAKFHQNELPPAPVVGQGPISVAPISGHAEPITPNQAVVSDVVNKIADQGKAAPPAPAATVLPTNQIPLNAGYDQPDANGLVALTGLSSGWRVYRFAVQEVALAIGGDLGARAQANVDWGNAEHISGIIPPCHEVTKLPNGTYRVEPGAAAIPGQTRALPHQKVSYKGVEYDLTNVKDATAFYNVVPVDGPHS